MSLKLIYIAENHIEAKLIKQNLSEENIDVIIYGSNLESAIGELPIEVKFPKIFVSNDNYIDAKLYIDNYKKNIRKTNFKNTNCNNCNEDIPGNFSICWNCGIEVKIKD